MRKHSLIALSAFTALGASALAGAAGSGTFNSTSVLSRSTGPAHPVWRASGAVASPLPLGVVRDDGVVLHDVGRPGGVEVIRLRHHKRHVVHHAKKAPVVAVTPVTAPPTTAVYAPSSGVWYELRMCESGGNYAEDSGNGYYGAYQFSLSTWYGLGFTGLPSQASPATQDLAAQELQARAGWDQWPGCAAKLGL